MVGCPPLSELLARPRVSRLRGLARLLSRAASPLVSLSFPRARWLRASLLSVVHASSAHSFGREHPYTAPFCSPFSRRRESSRLPCQRRVAAPLVRLPGLSGFGWNRVAQFPVGRSSRCRVDCCTRVQSIRWDVKGREECVGSWAATGVTRCSAISPTGGRSRLPAALADHSAESRCRLADSSRALDSRREMRSAGWADEC